MIAKINSRAKSFTGVMSYLMHDKKAMSAERVAWYETGNLHTDDPKEAARLMAWTDENTDALKEAAGGSTAGRKGKGASYHYSLSWAHGENPDQEHQRAQALATIEKLGLQNHQYVLVAHNDTEHAHVHIVVNLIELETGKRAELSFDKRALQEWALEYERMYGIHCEKRVENARRRAEHEPTKYQDERQDYAEKVRTAYEQADSGRAFAAALEAQGLTLAQGRRGGAFVIVDEHGDIQKLSRQIEGVKAKDIKARLADIDAKTLPDADTLAKERAQARQEQPQPQPQEQQPEPPQPKPEELKPPPEVAPAPAHHVPPAPEAAPLPAAMPPVSEPVLSLSSELPSDAKRSADAAAAWRAAKVKEIEAFYRVRELQEQHRQAAEYAQKKATFWGWLTGQQRAAAEAAEVARKNLENAQQRESEALRALDRRAVPGIEAHGLAKDDRQEQGRLRAAQEREQLEASKQAQEKENAALREAMASPAQAAGLKASVNAKTLDQAADLAQVRAKAEAYEQEQGPEVDLDKEQVKAQVRAAFARSAGQTHTLGQVPGAVPPPQERPRETMGRSSTDREDQRFAQRDAQDIEAERAQVREQVRERFQQSPEQERGEDRRLDRD